MRKIGAYMFGFAGPKRREFEAAERDTREKKL